MSNAHSVNHDHQQSPLLFPAKQSSSKLATTVGKAPGIRASFLNVAYFIYLITRDVYKTGSSSKRPAELWIRPIFSTGSRVYVMLDVPDKPCIRLARNAYRSGASDNGGRSAHSLLWIYISLSTACMGERAACSAAVCLVKLSLPANLRCGGPNELGQVGLTRQPNNSKPARKKIFGALRAQLFRFTSKGCIQG